MKFTAAIACLVAIAFAAPLGSPQGASSRGVCAPTNAQKTTIAAIASDPAAWMGKCVTVSGLYNSERLYADVDAAYGISKASIGGYVDGKGSMDGFWQAEFTGRVSDCAVAENELATGLLRSPGISLDGRTLGCLAPEGPFLLFMSQHDIKPAKVVRRLPGGKGADLTLAPADWEHRAAVEGAAAEFLAALRAGDEAALGKLLHSDYAADLIVEGPETAISALRKPGDRKPVIFTHGASRADKFESEACYCLTKECTKRWPIARRDADNQKERPYACLRVDGAKQGGAWALTVDANRDFDGLPEP